MIDGFLHPGLALGVLAALVPLVIHLLNRRRHKPMAFGAMRFVLAAHKRTRRRARLENLLLLLMRMAAVALLALALARPFLGRDALLSPLAESRRHLVVILDASASTGYRDTLDSSFDRILDAARTRLDRLDGGRGDRAHLVLGDARPSLLSWREPSEALSLLDTLQRPTDGPLDLTAALAIVREQLESSAIDPATSQVELILFTDLQRSVLLGEDGEEEAGGAGWRAELDRLAEAGLQLAVADLGPKVPLPENLGIEEVRPVAAPRMPGESVEIAVTVRNHGARVQNGVRVALVFDGSRLPIETLDLAPGTTGEVRFRTPPSQPGEHLLVAELEPDGLAFDDTRASVITVPAPIRVLAVNGAPDPDRLEQDELGLVTFALMPPDGDGLAPDAAPFELDVVEPAELASGLAQLRNYDFFLLANVESLPGRVIDELSQRVAEGAGILFSMGDRTDPALYAERFYSSDGTGLLPAEPIARRAVASRRSDYFRITEFDGQSPILAFFEDDRWRPYLTEVPFFEFVEVAPLEDARVLARLDERTLDDRGAPLLIERAFGRGRTYLWTSTLDSAWTRLPLSPRTSIPLLHELVRAGGRPRGPEHEVPLGAPLVAELPAFPRSPVVLRPDGSRRSVEGEPRELDGGRFRLLLLERAEEAGAYQLETESAEPVPFAVTVDPTEGNLERLDPAQLDGLHPGLVRVAADSEGVEAGDTSGARGELWRFAAAAALFALILDSLFGAWLGFRRAGGAA